MICSERVHEWFYTFFCQARAVFLSLQVKHFFNLEISTVDLDFRDWLYGIKEGVWVRFIRKNCYVYLKGCPANTSSCVLIGSSELVIIRSLYMTSSRQVHLVLFRICMLESCDKLWSHLGHFHRVTQHFCLGTCKRHPYLLKSSLLNRSKHVQGVRITVSNLRWSRSRHRHWSGRKDLLFWGGKISSCGVFMPTLFLPEDSPA